MEPILLFGGFLALIAVLAVFGHLQVKRRREDFKALAQREGFSYAQQDLESVLDLGRGFKLFQEGTNRRACNVLTGRISEVTGVLADFHYTTGSGKHAQNHQITVCLIHHPRLHLPEAFLRRQVAVFDALGKWFGGQDLNFDDDPQFSNRFVLQGHDEPATRTLFNPEVRSWCVSQAEQHPGLRVECRLGSVLLHYGNTLTVEQTAALLQHAISLIRHWLRPPWLARA